MKSSFLLSAWYASFTAAQRPSPAVTTETIYSCPTSATEYLTLTVALVENSTATEAVPAPTTSTKVAFEPVPTTTTDVIFHPVTIVQTITTTIYSVTTIIPLPITQTSTTSEKLYPVVSIYSTTEQVTSLTICPSRTSNPTYTAQFPLPTEYTWGCPPGYLCRPDQIGCNFEAGLPAEKFYCSPDQCIVASALPNPLQTWDNTIYGNSTPTVDAGLTFNVINHYFNMNPQDYGLPYEIFVDYESFTFTSTIGYSPTPAVEARQAETSVPGECYPWCNDCLLEAQSVGKTPALCDPDSAYEQDLANCQQCIAYHSTENTGTFVQIAPQFQQFMDYCAAVSAPPPPSPAPVTVYSTFTVQPDLSSTATITYSSTFTSRQSGLSSTTKSSLTTTITSPVILPVATSSSTEWFVPSGSSTITFDSSPVVTTQWTMTSSGVTIVFATSPVISASIILDGTSTVALLTTSTTSKTTSSAVSSIVVPTSGTSATTTSPSPTFSNPAASTFTGAASNSVITEVTSRNSWFSILCVVIVAILGDWH